MIEPQTYALKHPIGALKTLTLHPPTLRLFVRVGTPYAVERRALDHVQDKVEHKLTANFRRLIAFLAEMTRLPRETVEKIDAEDLSALLLIVRAMTLHNPDTAGRLFDDLVFSPAAKLDLRTVEDLSVPEAAMIRDRAAQYVARTNNGNK